MLANEGARLREKSAKQTSGDDLSESSDESNVTEELGYISPLEGVDPYVSFKQALTGTATAVSHVFQRTYKITRI